MNQSHDLEGNGYCIVTGPPTGPRVTPPPSSFGILSRLPRELIDRIIKLACRAPEKTATAKSIKERSTLALDKATTLNLCLVSRPISLAARFTLWESPILIRPSALLEMRRTLKSHACWAKLIKNLHIGGEETLPETDWPLMMEDKEDGVTHQYPVLWIRTSWGFADEERLPKWCEPERSWCFDPWRLDCRGKAITAMLFDAMEGIDVEVYKRRYGKSGDRIGIELWATRVFELQAILDHYLLEMRRIEDEHDYAVSSCRPPTSTPGLQATELEPEEEAGENSFTITRAQVWSHLTRRGAPLDQFDHPIIFARCGFRSAPINQYGRDIITSFLEGPQPHDFTPDHYDPEEDGESDSDDEDPTLHEECAQKALGLAYWNTMPKLGVAASEVIRRAKNLENLSLNGTLDLALSFLSISGGQDLQKMLRTLNLGPLLPIWKEGMHIIKKASKLGSLENLRLCGAALDEKEADELAGAGEGFGNLKRVQWEMAQAVEPATRPVYGSERLLGIITQLQGKANNTSSGNDDDDSSRLIEVRLHPTECSSILALAPLEQRTALLQGKRQSDKANRVRLTESEAAKSRGAAGCRRLHTNSREWFEECAAERPRGKDWMPNAGGGGGLAPRGLPKRGGKK